MGGREDGGMREEGEGGERRRGRREEGVGGRKREKGETGEEAHEAEEGGRRGRFSQMPLGKGISLAKRHADLLPLLLCAGLLARSPVRLCTNLESAEQSAKKPLLGKCSFEFQC